MSCSELTCHAIESDRVSAGNRTESDVERLRITSRDGIPVLRVALKAAAEWMTCGGESQRQRVSKADTTLLRSVRLLLLLMPASLRTRAQRQLKPAPYSSLAESTAACSGMPPAAPPAALPPPLLAASTGESRAWRKDLSERRGSR